MPDFSPWDAGRIPLAEDCRPYSDSRRPGVTIPPIRFREMEGVAEDEYLGRYLAYQKQYAPKEKQEQPATNGKPFGDRPMVRIEAGQKPSAWEGPTAGTPPAQEQPAGFDRLPPEAQSAIAAAAAKKQGVGPLYAGKDGHARKLPDNLLANVAMLETMYVPDPGDPKPYTFDDWIGFATNFRHAYRAMLVVCTCLSLGRPLPPVGEELKYERRMLEGDADPPAAGGESRPDTPDTPSNAGIPIPTPSDTTTPRWAPFRDPWGQSVEPSDANPPTSART